MEFLSSEIRWSLETLCGSERFWSEESSVGAPLEVNVVIQEPEGMQRSDSHAYVASNSKNESINDVTVLYEREKDVRTKINSDRIHEMANPSHKSQNKENDSVTVIYEREKEPGQNQNVKSSIEGEHHAHSTEDILYKKGAVNNLAINMELETPMTVNVAYNFESEKANQNVHVSSLSGEDSGSLEPSVVSSGVEGRSAEDTNIQNLNAANKFLNELYDKKLDLNNQFSEQEISDIRKAVQQHVTLLAKTIGEIDLRLNIQEIIPVGSARERTQIIRPCEYDYILVLKALSKPGAVSLTPADPDDKNRTFMHVRLNDKDVKYLFHELCDDGYIRGSHWLPCFQQGLREVFCSALHQAVMSNTTPIQMSTGQLRTRHSRPESHGPAFMIRLFWERKITNYTTMEISVDICPALKLDMEPFESVLPPVDHYYLYKLPFIDSIESIILMPREGHLFKVTFTETEVLCTLQLSQHHLKCYKLLKYLVNGEPFPRERYTNKLLEPFKESNTVFHSYALKTKVWDHHYQNECAEENDLSICITEILSSKLSEIDRPARSPVCVYSIETRNADQGQWPTKESVSTARLKTLLKVIERIRNTPTEEYNFEKLCRVIEPRGIRRMPAKTLAKIIGVFVSILGLSLCVGMVFGTRPIESQDKIMVAIGAILFLFASVYILFTPGVSYLRQHMLTLRSYKCRTSQFNCSVIVFCTLLYIVGLAFLVASAPGWQVKLGIGFLGFGVLPCYLVTWRPRRLCD